MTRFFAGTSNIVLPITQKNFPPEHSGKSRLQYLAAHFNSLEVNSSFYKIPQPATVAKWAAAVPPDFRFTFKLLKTLTHCKKLEFCEEEIPLYFKAINEAAERKGCILVQLPPSAAIEQLDQLDHLLSGVKFYNTFNWPVAVEFRNDSWYEREVEETLSNNNAFTVFHDMLKCPHAPRSAESEIVYMRFHGPEPRYRGSYSHEELSKYAAMFWGMIKKKKTVYCYFNNTMGDAYANLETMFGMINPS